MLKLYDYRCKETKEVFERLAYNEERILECKCGSTSDRMISPIKCQLDPFSGHFPGATMKWAKHHEAGGKRKGNG